MKRQRRPCSYEGCRAWAKTGMAWCGTHPDGVPRGRADLALPGNQKGRKHGLYSGYVPVVEIKEALQLPPGDLRLEIAVVRQVLSQVLARDLPTSELVEAVEKTTSALVRMLRANKGLIPAADDGMEEALERYLRELGLGGA